MHHFFLQLNPLHHLLSRSFGMGCGSFLILMVVWASLRYYQNEQFRKIFRNYKYFN